jgi:putative hydrolase of the HAD superfamily
VAILSDQTNWLDELDDRDDFFKEFDYVFNSFHLGKGKGDPSLFTDVAQKLGLPCERILFIDDNEAHVARAGNQRLIGIVFRGQDSLIAALKSLGLSS